MVILCFALGLIIGYFTCAMLTVSKLSDLESEVYYYKKQISKENTSAD